VGDEQQPSTGGVTDREISPFIYGMIGVINCCSQRIIEHGHGFVEEIRCFSRLRRAFSRSHSNCMRVL
jgi:hypothetical protein